MKIFLITILLIFSVGTFAKESANHKDHKPGEEKHEDHAEEKSDEHGDHDAEGEDDHAESAEANPEVGEGKGIVAASAKDGIKLSLQAIKNFEIETIKVKDLNSLTIPKKAVVTAGDEVNIFRLRDGFYKRVDFVALKKENGQISIKSKELKLSDEVVVQGTGFLRIAEIAAFGGAPEGHSH